MVALTHSYGCGVAITATDAYIPIRTVRNLARNPNLGGEALVISLGCEKLQAGQVMHEDDGSVDLSEPWLYRLQDSSHGFTEMIEQIMALAETRLKKLDQRRRETVPASELILGMQCGGSDAFSGITANPALGYASDLLLRAGATVMFSEVTEVRDAIYLLTSRAKTEEVAQELVREMDWYDRYLAKGEADRSANTTPGNKKGGLSNIVEKSLGSIVKSGSSAITGVLGPGERFKEKGLIFCATPASDFVCGTLQLAAGMNLHVFTTGPRHAVRAGHGAGGEGIDPDRTGAALAGPDRHRRRAHCHRARVHRGAWLGVVPLLPGCGQRQATDLGRKAQAA